MIKKHNTSKNLPYCNILSAIFFSPSILIWIAKTPVTSCTFVTFLNPLDIELSLAHFFALLLVEMMKFFKLFFLSWREFTQNPAVSCLPNTIPKMAKVMSFAIRALSTKYSSSVQSPWLTYKFSFTYVLRVFLISLYLCQFPCLPEVPDRSF